MLFEEYFFLYSTTKKLKQSQETFTFSLVSQITVLHGLVETNCFAVFHFKMKSFLTWFDTESRRCTFSFVAGGCSILPRTVGFLLIQ